MQLHVVTLILPCCNDLDLKSWCVTLALPKCVHLTYLRHISLIILIAEVNYCMYLYLL